MTRGWYHRKVTSIVDEVFALHFCLFKTKNIYRFSLRVFFISRKIDLCVCKKRNEKLFILIFFLRSKLPPRTTLGNGNWLILKIYFLILRRILLQFSRTDMSQKYHNYYTTFFGDHHSA